MKMVLAMLLLFMAAGALSDRITPWTLVLLGVAISGILMITRLCF
jgi:hypothetical protein